MNLLIFKLRRIFRIYYHKSERIRFYYRAIFALAAIPLVITLILFTNIIWALTVPIPPFGQLQNRHVGESTKLYDRTGKVLLYDTSGSMRQINIPIALISPHLIDATIAIEDATFYEHHGVRLSAIMRALLTNITSVSFDQGGSTITQQVVKNTLLTNNKSVIRKVKELLIALRVEKHYTKNEILETYFNEIPYGSTIYGAEEASQAYFDKAASDLTLSEAAYLAALTKAPTYLSPWGSNRSALIKQHNLVLDKMLKDGTISKKEHQEALAEEITFKERDIESIRAPHFVFYVLDELEKKYGEEKLFKDGLKVTTTLDWELQKESEEIIRLKGKENEKNSKATNASLVAIDPKSGQVLAMVGSRDYFNDAIDGQVNVALASRQPGSAFKPFVYATAFKKGYTPETVLFDLKTQFSTACAPYDFSNVYPCYSPSNYGNDFSGPISMRNALAQSINIVGVKTLYLSGVQDSINTARSLGITTLEDTGRYGLSLVLGGGEVKLLEMTAAYGGFANDGEWHKPTPILAIHTRSGDVLESYQATPVQVLDKNIARTINDILSDNQARAPEFGLYSPLYFKDAVVAAKTGTTNDYRDAWVIGYTPSIVVGAWAGNNDNTPMVRRSSSFILGPTWHIIMEKAMARFPSTPFEPPEKSFATLPPSLSGRFDITASSTDVHEILYWGDKNNPQLALWEYPVFLWAQERELERSLLASATNTPIYDEAALGIGGPEETSSSTEYFTPDYQGILTDEN